MSLKTFKNGGCYEKVSEISLFAVKFEYVVGTSNVRHAFKVRLMAAISTKYKFE